MGCKVTKVAPISDNNNKSNSNKRVTSIQNNQTTTNDANKSNGNTQQIKTNGVTSNGKVNSRPPTASSIISVIKPSDIDDDNTDSRALEPYPDPSTVPIHDVIVFKAERYPIESTFWKEKRKLIPDYSALRAIDEHAIKAPASLKQNPQQLVSYLLKPAKTEVEKVRVLVRWMGENIAYHVEGGRNHALADCTFEGVLRSGRTICEGYSVVLLELCKIAGIPCEKISGMTKNGETPSRNIRDPPESDHAWNKVRINGQWLLVDSTWCAGSVGSEKFTKQWNEWWFLPDPSGFIYTHLPMKSNNNIDTDNQLIKQPFTSANQWDRLIYRSPAAFAFGIEPLTHPDARFTNQSEELILKFRSKLAEKRLKLRFLAHINLLQNNYKTEQQSHWTMAYETNGVIYCHVRFPQSGLYELDICLQFEDFQQPNGVQIVETIGQYLIEHKASSKGTVNPFPSEFQWGETTNFVAASFKVLEPSNGRVIRVNSGRAKIVLKLPTWGIVGNMHHLEGRATTASSKSTSSGSADKTFDEWVYAEKQGRTATYHITCPMKGEYRFEVWHKYEKNSKSFQLGAAFLVCSSEDPIQPLYKHPDNANLLARLGGPWKYMFDLGLTCSSLKSTLELDSQGNGVLVVRKTKQPVSVCAEVLCANNDDGKALLVTDDKGDDVKFTISKPTKPGFYWLLVYANQNRNSSYSCAGCFCFPYNVNS